MDDNTAILERIEDSVATLLGGDFTDRDKITKAVKSAASVFPSGTISRMDIPCITQKLETRLAIIMMLKN